MCVGIAASCLTSIALSLGCAACGAVGGVVSKATRFSYALMLLFATFLAVAMLSDMMKDWILESFTDAWSLPTPADCEGLDCYTPAAIQARAQNAAVNATMQHAHDQLEAKLGRLAGALAVNRVMLGVAVFHGILAVILFGVANSNDPRSKLQNGAWGLKLALYFGLIGAMFFPGADSFTGVPSLFRVGGFIFILVQLTMLIDSSYMTFSSLLDMGSKQEEAGSFPFWNWVILLITLCGYGFMLFVCVVTIAKNNREDDGCAEGVWAVCLVFLFTIVTSVLSISPFVRDASNGAGSENGVFQSGMVAAYASYQVLSALINHPEERCHLMDIHDGSTPIKMLGLFFTFVAVLWSAVRSGSHTDAGALPLTSTDATNVADAVDEGRTAARDDEQEVVQYNYSQFHAEFALASMYIAMLLTRWGELDGAVVDKSLMVKDSMTSVWIKIISSWLCFAMYALVMLLPPMCPDRNFGPAARAEEMAELTSG